MREKIVTPWGRFFYHLRLLPLVVILIMANSIWAHVWGDLSDPERLRKKSADILIYAASRDNPDICGTDQNLLLGTRAVDVDDSYFVKASPSYGCVSIDDSDLPPRQLRTRRQYCFEGLDFWIPLSCMFCDGKDNGDYWYRSILAYRWWKSQRTDTKTSYCGVVEFQNYNQLPYTDPWIDKPRLSWNDREKLQGVIITDWPASLKLTVTGRRVKIEPLHACYDPTGRCIKDRLLWESEPCPRFTTSAGKGSSCVEPVPVPESQGNKKRACCINGSCQFATAEECKTLEGTFMPNKTSCTPNPCVKAKNGCCLNGECVDLPPTECGERCGEPLNRPCSGNFEADCGKLTGACMLDSGCRPSQTRCFCENFLVGKYMGPRTGCPKGACCFDGKCDLETKADCGKKGDSAVFLPNKTCDQDPCQPSKPPTPQLPKGACCADGVCSLETEEGCRAKSDNAVFLPGKTCDPDPCKQPEPPKGGCCDAVGKCEENVAEADCLLRQDARFFPDGCPGTCPPVEGACYVPCALAPSVMDCSMVSIRECVAKNNARFELNKKCPDIKTCENCGPCEQAYAIGEWFLTLTGEKAKMTLRSDCKGALIIEKLGGDSTTNLPITQSPIIRYEGTWYCSGENVIVDWRDLGKSTLIINKERATPRLCYRDGDKFICAEMKPRPDEALFVISVEGNGASPHWAGASYVQSGSHEEIFRLKRGQDRKTELEAYHRRLLGDVCKIVNPPGMISKDAPPQIFNWAEITVLTGPITDAKQLEGRTLKNTWKTINENGISLGELRKRGGCGD